jgi:hypothetical protein
MFHVTDAEREEEDKKFSNVRVLDLKTLTSVLTGEVYSFPASCDLFGAPVSKQRKTHSRVTKPGIERLLRDVTAELELLNRLTQEFEKHPVDLLPDRCCSPATLAKAYLFAMGTKPPQEKFRIPDRICGIATQASAGGRAEYTIGRTPIPVTYVDFHAQFASVSKLPGCREMHSQMKLDPRRDDLAVMLVELRSAMKSKSPELIATVGPVQHTDSHGVDDAQRSVRWFHTEEIWQTCRKTLKKHLWRKDLRLFTLHTKLGFELLNPEAMSIWQ